MTPGSPHDPGPAAAAARITDAEAPRRLAARRPVLIGTGGWTDRTLTARGVFYPPDAKTPELRLRHFASRFPFVEIDATYYALPAAAVAEHWAERTPNDFV